MTTDTYPKVATARVKIAGVEVTINGMAKGAGMIAPDMATMLSYVFTDAPIASKALQAMLSKSVEGMKLAQGGADEAQALVQRAATLMTERGEREATGVHGPGHADFPPVIQTQVLTPQSRLPGSERCTYA